MFSAVWSGRSRGSEAPAPMGTSVHPTRESTRRALCVVFSRDTFPATVVTASRSNPGSPQASIRATASSWPGSTSRITGFGLTLAPLYGADPQLISFLAPRTLGSPISLTIKCLSDKVRGNWGVAARCSGGTGRQYGARLPAGYRRQGATSETIGRQRGRDGSLFHVSRPVREEMGYVFDDYARVRGGAGRDPSWGRLLYERGRDTRGEARYAPGGRGKPARRGGHSLAREHDRRRRHPRARTQGRAIRRRSPHRHWGDTRSEERRV